MQFRIQGKNRLNFFIDSRFYFDIRMRINKSGFEDGDVVYIRLKDRSRKQTEEEKDWYEKAFGSKQNIMTSIIAFHPQVRDNLKKGRADIWAVVKYSMFPEMEGEFKKEDYP